MKLKTLKEVKCISILNVLLYVFYIFKYVFYIVEYIFKYRVTHIYSILNEWKIVLWIIQK